MDCDIHPLTLSQTAPEVASRSPRIVLRPKLAEDVADDYRWRKDPFLAYLDATIPVTLDFEEYQKSYIEEIERPFRNYLHFGIDTVDGVHIGNCMLYDIDEWRKEAQLGILIGERRYWDRAYGQEAICLLLKKGFADQRISRVYLHTLRDNYRAQKCFEKCGFKACGTTSLNGYDFVVMEVFKELGDRR